jgi:hypothetical protein
MEPVVLLDRMGLAIVEKALAAVQKVMKTGARADDLAEMQVRSVNSSPNLYQKLVAPVSSEKMASVVRALEADTARVRHCWGNQATELRMEMSLPLLALTAQYKLCARIPPSPDCGSKSHQAFRNSTAQADLRRHQHAKTRSVPRHFGCKLL